MHSYAKKDKCDIMRDIHVKARTFREISLISDTEDTTECEYFKWPNELFAMISKLIAYI